MWLALVASAGASLTVGMSAREKSMLWTANSTAVGACPAARRFTCPSCRPARRPSPKAAHTSEWGARRRACGCAPSLFEHLALDESGRDGAMREQRRVEGFEREPVPRRLLEAL